MQDLDNEVSLARSDDAGAYKMPLFEAVRKWSDSEEKSEIIIVVGARQLSAQEIDEISKSAAFTERLLAFNDRR